MKGTLPETKQLALMKTSYFKTIGTIGTMKHNMQFHVNANLAILTWLLLVFPCLKLWATYNSNSPKSEIEISSGI